MEDDQAQTEEQERKKVESDESASEAERAQKQQPSDELKKEQEEAGKVMQDLHRRMERMKKHKALAKKQQEALAKQEQEMQHMEAVQRKKEEHLRAKEQEFLRRAMDVEQRRMKIAEEEDRRRAQKAKKLKEREESELASRQRKREEEEKRINDLQEEYHKDSSAFLEKRSQQLQAAGSSFFQKKKSTSREAGLTRGAAPGTSAFRKKANIADWTGKTISTLKSTLRSERQKVYGNEGMATRPFASDTRFSSNIGAHAICNTGIRFSAEGQGGGGFYFVLADKFLHVLQSETRKYDRECFLRIAIALFGVASAEDVTYDRMNIVMFLAMPKFLVQEVPIEEGDERSKICESHYVPTERIRELGGYEEDENGNLLVQEWSKKVSKNLRLFSEANQKTNPKLNTVQDVYEQMKREAEAEEAARQLKLQEAEDEKAAKAERNRIKEEQQMGDVGAGRDEVHKAMLREVASKGGAPVRSVSLFMIGEGRNGKTATLRSIRGAPFQDTPSTIGADGVTLEAGRVEGGGAGGWREAEPLESLLADACARHAVKGGEGEVAGSITDYFREGEGAESDGENKRAPRAVASPKWDTGEEGDDGDGDDGDEGDGEGQEEDPEIEHESGSGQLQGTGEGEGREVEGDVSGVEDVGRAAVGEDAIRELEAGMVMRAMERMESGGVGGEEVTFDVLDIGGQEVFQVLFHMFFRRTAIYMLCFSLERMASVDEEERARSIAQVEFWLESVATYADGGGSKAAVLLVGTHKDTVDLKGQEAANERLSREFLGRPSFAGVVRNDKAEAPSGRASWCYFPVDNKTQGVKDPMVVALREAVLKLALKDPMIRMQVQLPWLRVVDEVKGGKELVLARSKAEALCRECGVQLGQEGGVLGFMHRRGIVLHLPVGQLRDFAVLKPIEFLIEPLTRLIRQQSIHGADDIPGATAHPDWQLFVEDAIATDSLLQVMWYDRLEHLELLLGLAANYGLLVPLSGQGEGFSEGGSSKGGGDKDEDGEYLVPTVLRREEPQAPEGQVSTLFLVFAGKEQMKRLRKMPWLTLRQYRKKAFLSYGIFCHFLGACVRHSQAVSRRSEMRLSANEAQLRIGGCLVMLRFEREIAAVRLSVLAQTTAAEVVSSMVLEIASRVLRHTVPDLECGLLLPSDGGMAGPSAYQDYRGHLCFLDGPRGLAAAVADRQDIDVGGGEFLDAVEASKRFAVWLPSTGSLDRYDVFISYRWGDFDMELARALYGLLCQRMVGGKRVEVFLDRERLEDGQQLQQSFGKALASSTVAMPLLSADALRRMLHLAEGSPTDNVLLEWLLMTELLAAGRLHAVFPIFMGTPLEQEGEGGEGGKETMMKNLFAEGFVEKLPDVVVHSVCEQAETVLRSLGIPQSDMLRQRTVRGIVKAITLQLGLPAWDVSSSHGGRARSTLAFRLSGFRAALARISAEKVYQVLRGAQARERRASAESAAGGGVGLEPQVDKGKDVGKNLEALEAQRIELELARARADAERARAEAAKANAEAERLRKEQLQAISVPPTPPPEAHPTARDQSLEVERLRLELELAKAKKR